MVARLQRQPEKPVPYIAKHQCHVGQRNAEDPTLAISSPIPHPGRGLQLVHRKLILRKENESQVDQTPRMKSVLGWFKKRFKKWYQPDTTMLERLETLAKSNKQEISCDEVFVVLDQFAEAVHRGENVLLFMPLIRQHLDICPTCREEYETLLRMLQPPLDA